ncbi:uncharacterized protein GGS22DRAFT_193854 [Annulohypoxylon maeteangense]|uniref:uncharacterized protein n=1 Tax=Annulohypoxylon maeteangense TaxID=1927788 RepID=UPI002008A3A1|nr:uncharacterized protein GGS22DRAFT_193854 [Annulohypoxylon maeteangense]KAI0879873.1 hypothetical protein GGS22DRAFT_193854 [Annulohypoxylon maeteangense]
MPPKRAASGSAASARKRAKTPTGGPPRSKRWSVVSASANADADYKTTWNDPDKWYEFMTICSPIQDSDEEEEEEDDDDDDDDDNTKGGKSKGEEEEADTNDDDDEVGGATRDGPGCGKKHCLCFKPASLNPDHSWVVSKAGYRKYVIQHTHLNLRDPDNFQMYTFNDHAGYGCVEIVQNLLLDYDEAAERGWREQWAVCEGLALWLLSSASGIMMMVDDGALVEATVRLAGRMFLDMLAQLDNQDLVGDATDVKSLGTFMAVFLKLVPQLREVGILDGERGNKKKFAVDHFDDAILSYANQRGVTLQGPEDIDELTADLAGEVGLPKKGKKDPWGWNAELKKYKDMYGKGNTGIDGIGGDALDITTWSSARRKAANFDHKDPLGKREIDAIKKGMVMQLG